MTWPAKELFKDPITCSDWQKYPLSFEQIHYAALDAYIAVKLLQQGFTNCILDEKMWTFGKSRQLLLQTLSPQVGQVGDDGVISAGVTNAQLAALGKPEPTGDDIVAE